MTMFDLPADLIEEILSRVPATSLKQLRSTCKQWNALFKNRRFTEKHFHKAPKQALFLLWKDFRVRSMNVNLKVATSIEFKGAISIKETHSNIEEVDIASVFHCDGLLLCTTKDNRLVVWNPCLGENRWIPLNTDYKRDTSIYTLGYQNKISCRSYKILRWWWNCNEPNRQLIFVGLEIYEFSSGSWRVLDNVPLDYILRTNTGVSLKGNNYWLNYNKKNFLASFDFTTERLKRLSLPPIPLNRISLSVFKEEQLSVLNHMYGSSNLDIWITNNIGSEADDLLWNKSFTVYLKLHIPYSYLVCKSYLIVEEKKLAVCCDVRRQPSGETSRRLVTIADVEYYIEFPYEEYTDFPIIFNYVPSLVQIQ